MHTLRHVLEFWSCLSAAMVLAVLAMIAMRGRRIPECFACGAFKVRPSRPMGFLDKIAGLLLIRPYRCEGCQERFRAFRVFDPTQRIPGSKARAIKIVFQYRDGFRVAIRSVE